jgi:hypothetical protein
MKWALELNWAVALKLRFSEQYAVRPEAVAWH